MKTGKSVIGRSRPEKCCRRYNEPRQLRAQARKAIDDITLSSRPFRACHPSPCDRPAIAMSSCHPANFKGTNAQCWDLQRGTVQYKQTPLTYYKDWSTGNVTVRALLRAADGQCNSFVALMNTALSYQGVTTALTINRIIVSAPLPNQWFLIGNWTVFPNNASDQQLGNQGRIEQAPGVWAYDWEGPVQYMGSQGQNNPHPAANFLHHFLLQIQSDGNTVYYDPSYGKMFAAATLNAAAAQFQTTSVAGFYTPRLTPGPILFSKPSTNLQVLFDVSNGS